MKNTAYVLITCLLLVTACSQQAELEKKVESEEITSEQASEAAPSELADAENSVEIGDDRETAETEEISSLESKADAAKLPIEAVTEIIKLDSSNQRGIPFKVVVPTYVPDGFEVSDIAYKDDRFGPSYKIQYLNADTNGCFEISAASGGFGGPTETFEQLVEIDSQALGKLTLGYTESHSISKQPLIAFETLTTPGTASAPQEYSFWSPSSADCTIVDFQEAEQVVESLIYVNSSDSTADVADEN
ncbi:MAG: hypothetical protein AAF703_20490 [Cyanobacteria bacterium P01_D01_bin.105]